MLCHGFHMHMYLVKQHIHLTQSSGGTIVEIGNFLQYDTSLCIMFLSADTHLPGNHDHKLGLSLLTLSIIFLWVRYSANDPFHIQYSLQHVHTLNGSFVQGQIK